MITAARYVGADRSPIGRYELDHPVAHIGRCRCGTAIRCDLYGGQVCSPFVTCPGCWRALRLYRLRGTVNESKRCSDRCVSATGPACDCECGGANHGGRNAVSL